MRISCSTEAMDRHGICNPPGFTLVCKCRCYGRPSRRTCLVACSMAPASPSTAGADGRHATLISHHCAHSTCSRD